MSHTKMCDAPTTSTAESITIDIHPAPHAWREALAEHTPHPDRAALGIPDDRPVVFSGHQPVVFHCGILAKLIAQDAIAHATNARRVWIVPDQDTPDLTTLRVPVGTGADLHERTVHILEPDAMPPGVPGACLPPAEPIDPTDERSDERLDELIQYLRGYTHEPTLARQFAHATIQLACDRLDIEPPRILFASELLSAEPLHTLIRDELLNAPQRCVDAYNAAVRDHPEARVRPLIREDQRTELPLWGLRDGRPRVAIDTDNIDDFTPDRLAPRGLLMSALARLRLGELFIHGSGGWTYDRITEQWVRDWLHAELTPMARASATVRLPLGFAPEEAIDPAQAHWQAHHARHHPALVGDDDAQRRRDALVQAIEHARAEGQDPDPHYRQLVETLEDHRRRNAEALASLARRVEHARAHARQIALANDRTWPFPLFPDETLHALRDQIRNAMS